ncbi:4'-phosphopantetheinyl transferase [Laetiporus sulphureus 93-53]|uniref:4'-phosphopantetheinyl transferase n=1 Tax=Laetiporus sulphureus 93-53 TaxID=1314785 RepID=A0A165IDT9_9APHY|nr:4'-phosphopantetheinyl transferase [Laetiporus sulphureus 93-53]KZT12940.1 4'-phosphopantetheinyl transferase [Laetiporus sulphureus 93-53]
MGIMGTGVDVLHLPRIASLIQRRGADRLASRILSDHELSIWNTMPEADNSRRTRFLAVRWSVKEAAYKALYPLAHPTWKEFTFHGLQEGECRKPFLEYNPVKQNATVGRIHTSVSHDGEYVFATVTMEEATNP